MPLHAKPVKIKDSDGHSCGHLWHFSYAHRALEPHWNRPIHSLQVISRGTSQPFQHNMLYLEYSSQHKVLTKHKY